MLSSPKDCPALSIRRSALHSDDRASSKCITASTMCSRLSTGRPSPDLHERTSRQNQARACLELLGVPADVAFTSFTDGRQKDERSDDAA